VIALLLRLYPASWRTRYGDEFAALLEARRLGPFDIIDILLGALDARLRLRGSDRRTAHRKGFPMSLRLGGIAAVIGGGLWLASFVVGMDGADEWDQPSAVIFLVANVVLLIGMAGLSAFQAREHPEAVWAAFLLPAGGAVLALIGTIMMATADPTQPEGPGWLFFVLGVIAIILGSGLFAVVTFRTSALPRPGAAALGIASLISALSFAAVSGSHAGVSAPAAAAVATFAIGWIVIGLQAIVIDGRSVAAGPA
jgi:hypothetical protein